MRTIVLLLAIAVLPLGVPAASAQEKLESEIREVAEFTERIVDELQEQIEGLVGWVEELSESIEERRDKAAVLPVSLRFEFTYPGNEGPVSILCATDHFHFSTKAEHQHRARTEEAEEEERGSGLFEISCNVIAMEDREAMLLRFEGEFNTEGSHEAEVGPESAEENFEEMEHHFEGSTLIRAGDTKELFRKGEWQLVLTVHED